MEYLDKEIHKINSESQNKDLSCYCGLNILLTKTIDGPVNITCFLPESAGLVWL